MAMLTESLRNTTTCIHMVEPDELVTESCSVFSTAVYYAKINEIKACTSYVTVQKKKS